MPKENPHKLLKSLGGEGAGDSLATDVARIRAFQDFLGRTTLMIECGDRKWRDGRNRR
jgi:hypothetical protein